ncbi:hypothetical protein [Myxococcus landrumensis]|uniref:Uncharacterized protein n=1 Tax=Myxococcus landrumensis TaxID=2813577 RepID=A0ABX7N989_9BACT|nr:hypothetical protein [Myxococcus landrumus]QSQ15329.1 hypothetical protein JY572_04385 [Myxococcus landrumus]
MSSGNAHLGHPLAEARPWPVSALRATLAAALSFQLASEALEVAPLRDTPVGHALGQVLEDFRAEGRGSAMQWLGKVTPVEMPEGALVVAAPDCFFVE